MEDKPECRFCANLGEVPKPLPREIDARGLPYLRCTFGRYDIEVLTGTPIPRYFAWSGIWRPNKTVAAAQKDCPHFKVHPQVITKAVVVG